jgi:hypothetical protein
MSLAGDYAIARLAAEPVAPPAPFVGPNGRLEVTEDGNLRVVRTDPGSGDLEMPPLGALAAAAWIVTTFG